MTVGTTFVSNFSRELEAENEDSQQSSHWLKAEVRGI